jgi:hypothetical protein
MYTYIHTYIGDNEWHLAPGHIFDVPKAVRVRNDPKEIAEEVCIYMYMHIYIYGES